MLRNMPIKDIEARTKVKFPQELVDYMTPKHQPITSKVTQNEWHCYDIPFTLVCGSMEVAQVIYDYLKPMAASFDQPLQIVIPGNQQNEPN